MRITQQRGTACPSGAPGAFPPMDLE
jgi:hypothetical protein